MGLLLIVIIGAIIYRLLKKKIDAIFAKPNFANKFIWITGGSSGIGEGLTKELNELGAEIVISSRNLQEMERVKAECKYPDRVTVFQLDMSKPKEVLEKTEQYVAALEKKGKKIDIVIENAGVSQRCAFKDYSFENHEYMTTLNYHGPVAHVKALLPHLQAKKGGQIVLINSICGLLTPGMRSSYVGSKHALTGFFGSLRAELHDDKIAVSEIYPGYVQTNISKNALVGGAGEKLGKTDTNIAEGMSTSEFVKEAVRAIYLRSDDTIISKDFKHQIGVSLRWVFPELINNLMYKNLRNQREAAENAR